MKTLAQHRKRLSHRMPTTATLALVGLALGLADRDDHRPLQSSHWQHPVAFQTDLAA